MSNFRKEQNKPKRNFQEAELALKSISQRAMKGDGYCGLYQALESVRLVPLFVRIGMVDPRSNAFKGLEYK